MSFRVLILLLFLQSSLSHSNNDSTGINNKKVRRTILVTASSAGLAGSLAYLNFAWFKQYSNGKFHFFNDNNEWRQMDKAGHAFTCYQTGRMMMDAFDWAGYSKKKKLWLAGGMGLYYMTVMECMDGFSSGWGFSWGDMGANTIGAAMAISQEACWKEQRILLKFSYAESGLAGYNPELLGEQWYTRILKDYNGQTYWLSVNPSSFLKKENRFPKWLNVAVGYSAYGMLGARGDSFYINDPDGSVYKYDVDRRMYLSLDVDLTRIKTKSKFLKGIFSVINVVKFPAPALQFGSKGTKGYWVYM